MTNIIRVILFFYAIVFHTIRNFLSGIIEPIKPFYITDRYKTVVIVSIQMFEILEVLDETRIDIQNASESGVLIKISIRMAFVLINA